MARAAIPGLRLKRDKRGRRTWTLRLFFPKRVRDLLQNPDKEQEISLSTDSYERAKTLAAKVLAEHREKMDRLFFELTLPDNRGAFTYNDATEEYELDAAIKRTPRISEWRDTYVSEVREHLSAKSLAMIPGLFGDLIATVGDQHLATLTWHDVRRWLDALKLRGVKGQTRRHKCGRLQRAWTVSARPHLADDARNPFEGHIVIASKPVADEFTTAELQLLLDARSRRGASIRDFVLVGIFSGLRLGEFARMEIRTVGETRCIWIPRSKTEAGKRIVPIHDAIASIDFEALKRRKGDSVAHLFMDVRKRAGIVRPGLNFRSLRRNFVGALERANVDPMEAAALAGHSRSWTYKRYGSGALAARLKLAVDKVEFPGLNVA
ncbi:MAG TPA: tyrosine-type recombinase/integrase [Candidatus Acidoferrum sp.]|nr:tyrosine-type recombinase/integrase [Candidatus Acidoferrum sp.]